MVIVMILGLTPHGTYLSLTVPGILRCPKNYININSLEEKLLCNNYSSWLLDLSEAFYWCSEFVWES